MKSMFVIFARLKNYFSQGNLYMAIANFFVTIFTWLAVMKLGIAWYLVIPLSGLIIITLVGMIDFNLVKPHEYVHANSVNDMKVQLDRIEKKLEVLV